MNLKEMITYSVRARMSGLTETIERFIVSMEGIRAEKTVSFYRDRLRTLRLFFGDHSTLADLTLDNLRLWRKSLLDQNMKYGGISTRPESEGHLSVFTVRQSIVAVRRFCAWCVEENILPYSPAKKLEMPSKPKTSRKGIPEDDLHRMIECARNNSRDYAMLLFLRDTACRRASLHNLKLSDLNLGAEDEEQAECVQVVEKGNKERTVFLTPSSLAALRDWVKIRPQVDHEYVFVHSKTGRPLTDEGVKEIMRRIARRAGIKANWSPHQWRHRAARKLIAGGANLAQVSQILGHSTVTVTVEFYGQLTSQQLHEAHRKHTKDLE